MPTYYMTANVLRLLKKRYIDKLIKNDIKIKSENKLNIEKKRKNVISKSINYSIKIIDQNY